MPVYLKYDSIYTDVNVFNSTTKTITDQAAGLFDKHVGLGNIISWSQEEFPETLTRTTIIGYRDSDAYNQHLTERQQLLGDIDAPGVTNTNFRLEDSI